MSFRLIKADGSVVHVSRDGEHGELFRLALGGYGLFGIIWDVTLRVDDNWRLYEEVLNIATEDVGPVYDALLPASAEGDIVVKYARVDTTTLQTAEVRRGRVLG